MKRILFLLVALLVITLTVFLFYGFKKSTVLHIEDKFGAFCLNCSLFEKGSAVGAYGF